MFELCSSVDLRSQPREDINALQANLRIENTLDRDIVSMSRLENI